MSEQNPATRRVPPVEIDLGLGYEFLLTFNVLGEHSTYDYDIGKKWFDEIQQKAGSALLTELKPFLLDCRFQESLLGLVYEAEAPHDVPALLAQLAAIEPCELRLYMLGYYQRSYRRTAPLDVIVQAAQGDGEAQELYLQTIPVDEGKEREYIRFVFSVGPEAMKAKVLDVLRRWYERVFREHEERILPILQRDVEAKRALLPTMSAERLIETATNGLEYVPERGLRSVLLIPSFVLRPWNLTSDYQDKKVFCYPVADENLQEDKNLPPARLVRLYKALADERRLRILKMLMARSYSLQELADTFGIPKTTMHHHLGLLRTAGLVRIQSNDKMYSLRQHMLSDVSDMLYKYLKDQ